MRRLINNKNKITITNHIKNLLKMYILRYLVRIGTIEGNRVCDDLINYATSLRDLSTLFFFFILFLAFGRCWPLLWENCGCDDANKTPSRYSTNKFIKMTVKAVWIIFSFSYNSFNFNTWSVLVGCIGIFVGNNVI